MSLSDSEDDCYGNTAQRLQTMKNKYKDDKMETVNLLKKSMEVGDCLTNIDKTVSKTSASMENLNESSEAVDESFLDNLIAEHSSNKRVTRSRKKKDGTSNSLPVSEAPKTPARGRGSKTRGRGRGSKTRGRGRGRGRGWKSTPTDATPEDSPSVSRSRGRRNPSLRSALSAFLPIYSVGNTDEYPDQSDSQALFSSSVNTDVVIIEDDPLDENEELSVKVYWQSSEFFKFSIRRFQKLTQIFKHFSHKENVSNDKLLFTYNEKILKPDDTPDSIEYSVAKFIDGGVVKQNVTQLVKGKEEIVINGIKIKFQCQNLKKPLQLTISLDDKFMVAMMKCAERLEKPLEKLRFSFDGDVVTGKISAREMDLEGGECIDVNVLS